MEKKSVIISNLNEPPLVHRSKNKKFKNNINKHYHNDVLCTLLKQRNAHVKNKKKLCSKFKYHKRHKFKIEEIKK